MEQVVLGIDIGLKSLSMCILTNKQILLWGVYNVLSPDQQNCETCGRKAKYITGFCGSHYSGEKLKKYEIKTKKVKSFSLQEICNKVLTLLNKLLSEESETFSKVTKVIIELQPKFNPKMCFVSNVIFTKLCDFYTNNACVKIKFEKACLKLKNYKGDKGAFVKNTYKNRKLKAVEYVTDCLSNYSEEMMEFFNKLKKADDASDSFLLAYNNT